MYGVSMEIWVLLLAVALDLALGELPNRLHPTVWMGKTISWGEKLAPKGRRGQLAFGAALAVTIPVLWGGAAYLGVWGLNNVHELAYLLVAALALKTTFAVKMLHRAAASVRSLLREGNLTGAREGMSALVSRDPSGLTPEQTTAATVESVSENLTDSLVGPLLAFAIFGLPGAVAYRAINTLDSMIGYHGRYEYLGKASARLDDLVNLVPARLTAPVPAGGQRVAAGAKGSLGVADNVAGPRPNGKPQRRLDHERHGRGIGCIVGKDRTLSIGGRHAGH